MGQGLGVIIRCTEAVARHMKHNIKDKVVQLLRMSLWEQHLSLASSTSIQVSSTHVEKEGGTGGKLVADTNDGFEFGALVVDPIHIGL